MDACLPRWSLCAAALALCAVGCRRDEVTHFTAPKSAQGPVSAAAALPQEHDHEREPEQGGGLKWTLPKGWTETHPGGMRVATLTPPVKGRVDVSVVALPGSAGGELANVNRWRGQIGLEPLDEGALARVRKTVRAKAGPIAVYDFTSDGEIKSRMVAAVATAGGKTWFWKMVGDARPVGDAAREFVTLIESVRSDE